MLTDIAGGYRRIAAMPREDDPARWRLANMRLLDILRRTGLRHVAAAIVLSAILFAPVLEETIYRGIVQSSFASITGQWRVAAVVMTSLLFTAFHATVIPWQMLAGIFLLSLILGWLYERSGNLLAPILAHAVFNALNLLVQFHVG